MRLIAKWWMVWTAAGALTCAAAATNNDSTETADPSEAELQSLRTRISELEAVVADRDWLNAKRDEEVRALVEDVLADADTRVALQNNGLSAGWDKGFFIASSDGSFRLRVFGMVQTRYVLSVQDNNAPEDTTRGGFELTRARLGFMGHVIDPTWRFLFLPAWLPNGRVTVLDAWILKELNDTWSLQIGQYKRPLWKEWLVSERRQQFIERSVLNARYFAINVQGIMLNYKSDALRGNVTYSDGGRTWNTPAMTPPGSTTGTLPWQLSNEYAFTGRFEWLLSGNWSDASDFESWQGSDPVLVLGGGAHYQVGEYGTDDPEIKLFQWTLDANVKFGGANIFAAVIGTNIDPGDGSATRNEWGVLVQGGVFLNEDWEVIARYEWGDLDGAGTVSDELSILTVGVNRFWDRHGLKWMTDLGYAFKAVDAEWPGTLLGWRPDGTDGDGQIVFRTQMQLLF